MPDTEYATVTVDVAREVRIPIDLLDDDNLSNDELADCAVDWFWNHRIEALADEPWPTKDDVAVSTVALPHNSTPEDDAI